MTVDLDDLKLEAKKLGVKGVHLFKSAEKIQAAIDEAKAESVPAETPADPVAFTKQPKPEVPEAATPKDTDGGAANILMSRSFNGAVHSVWVSREKIEEWSSMGYGVAG